MHDAGIVQKFKSLQELVCKAFDFATDQSTIPTKAWGQPTFTQVQPGLQRINGGLKIHLQDISSNTLSTFLTPPYLAIFHNQMHRSANAVIGQSVIVNRDTKNIDDIRVSLQASQDAHFAQAVPTEPCLFLRRVRQGRAVLDELEPPDAFDGHECAAWAIRIGRIHWAHEVDHAMAYLR